MLELRLGWKKQLMYMILALSNMGPECVIIKAGFGLTKL